MQAVTHNGVFHADDVFAAAVLKIAYPGILVQRTLDPKVIAEADIVFDVGAQYDPASNRFDHHQKDGAGDRPNGVKYAAFGLVWAKFGPDLVGEEVAAMVDERLVQIVDAGDNGQEIFTPVHSYGVSKVISASTFLEAVTFAITILDRVIVACIVEIRKRRGEKMQAVTHNGIFHADDVFAAAVLKIAYPGILVQRTRDPKVIAEADIVFDVGAQHDPVSNRFDHHQREGAGDRPNGVKYAAFGLVWAKFGPGLVGDEIAAMVDERLVQIVDAGDNGQAISTPTIEGVHPYEVSKVISSFNASWHEESKDTFLEAVTFAITILDRVIAMCTGEIRARELVRAAIAAAHDDRVIVLDTFCPWQQIAIEESKALFVVYPAETGDTWMIQCIPPTMGSFEKRMPLPEAWAGLRDAAFAEAAGVEDAVFCHPGRFICGARTKEGAERLVQKIFA